MATQLIPNHQNEVHTPSTYRLAGSCGFRAYVNCDDTPYHLEQPISVTTPNPTPERAATVRALVRALGASKWLHVSSAALALIDANPDATVAELVAMLNQ